MEKLLIVSNTTYATALTAGTSTTDNIASLATGAICAFNENGLSVDAATIAGNKIRFGLGRTTYGNEWSEFIPRIASAEFAYELRTYVAPVAQVTRVGYDGSVATTGINTWLFPASYVEGDIFEMIVEDLSKPVYDNSRLHRYNYTITASTEGAMSDAIAQIILIALDTAIAADVNACVTCTYGGAWDGTSPGDTAYLELTASTAGSSFAVTFRGAGTPENADVTTTVANTKGSGYTAAMTELETYCSAYDGNTTTATDGTDLYSVPTRVISATTYDVYTLSWYANRTGKKNNSSNPDRHVLHIACATGAADINTKLNALLAAI